MKKTTALFAVTLFSLGFAGSAVGTLWAQRGKKSPAKMEEVNGGVIPNEYGTLVAAGGDAESTTLVFRKSNNDLCVVKMRGSAVPTKVTVIQRQY
ncbi:MAG: hypothetical protein AAF488_13710 [Planctomycetota bacterium]